MEKTKANKNFEKIASWTSFYWFLIFFLHFILTVLPIFAVFVNWQTENNLVSNWVNLREMDSVLCFCNSLGSCSVPTQSIAVSRRTARNTWRPDMLIMISLRPLLWWVVQGGKLRLTCCPTLYRHVLLNCALCMPTVNIA